MLFSSLLFLLLYLPLVVVLSLPGNRRWQNGWLLFASLLFHAWGGFSYTLLLWASIGFNFLLGRRIEREQTAGRAAKKTLWLGVGLNLGLLVVFKYTVFFGENVNALLQLTRIPPFELPRIALPLGISFYTFQGLSYLIDVYRGEVRAQASLARLGLFISFFPQLIAGPIVRYRTFVDQLTERVRSWDRFAAGTERFIWGLSKKVLLANNFGRVADELFALDSGSLSPAAAWTGLLCYSLQIYYDFSGYSDMAIGLGRLFGFELPENFNYPYAARSVRDFWRRWHITLGAWFRDYVYLPLGGSRVGSGRTYRNLLIVFVLTGLWHGAAWTFLLWGLWHGACIVAERRLGPPPPGGGGRLRRAAAHLYLPLSVGLAWVLFRSESLGQAVNYYAALLGGAATPQPFDWAGHANTELYGALFIGLLGCTTVAGRAGEWVLNWAGRSVLRTELAGLIRLGVSLFLLTYCLLELSVDAYNPFIYFRF